ncbi:MAG: MFS transporter [Verrucomicrobia bacterium GWF2_62_7]|nr:MAG: MFS transporter [Verrucomicrobia bacterium GWF2_62_7]
MNHQPRLYKWELLAILWVAYFLNQGDRQIYNAVLPLIKADLKVSDVQLGMVATAFTLLYGVFVPLAGCLGDFVTKKWIVCLSLLTFSAGTLCTGFSTSILLLILFRSVATGVGEAFYYPAANSLIGQYHHSTRAQAMAVHQSSLYVGIIASSWIAGWVGESHGWRATFYTFGSFGLLMAAVVAMRLRNEHRDFEDVRKDNQLPESQVKLGEVLRSVLRTPTLYFLSVAFGAMVFATVGYMTWMPTFLYEKFHLSVKDAALNSMLYHFIFAFVGVMVGGRVSDRLAARRPTIRMEMEYLGLLLGAPFIWLMGTSSNLTMVYIALAGFGFFRGIYDSNLFAALFDVIPPRYRSSATGLMLCCAFTVGATSPVLLGYVKQHISLDIGLSSLAFVYLLGAALIFIATKMFFAKDYIHEMKSE